jgi:signal transduction protein with GAF and PtsI domain
VHSNFDSLIRELETRLAQREVDDRALQLALELVLERLTCVAGTIHSFNPKSSMLSLRARRNIPDSLLSRIQQIPIGKGMAGLAAEWRKPIQVCNLQADTSGVAKPGAKETGMEGSIALPIMVNMEVVGVLGVAKPTVYEFKESEIGLLMELGQVIGRFMAPRTPLTDSEIPGHG